MNWDSVLILMHIIGVVLGVGGATFIEIILIHALRDGIVSPEESTLMQMSYNTIRIGFFLLIMSGFGLLILGRLTGDNEIAYSPQFWVKLSIVGIIGINAALMQLHRIPLAWGSAIALTSWYAALTLGALHDAEFPVLGIVIAYVCAIVVTYVVLKKIHNAYTPTPH